MKKQLKALIFAGLIPLVLTAQEESFLGGISEVSAAFSNAGGENQLQAGTESLGIVDVTVSDSKPGAKVLRMAIERRNNDQIDPRMINVHIFFYEEDKTGAITVSLSNPSPQWVTHPADWRDEQSEVLEVEYPLPDGGLPGNSTEFAGGGRKYYGYVLGVYYKGKLQDMRADPSDLVSLYPLASTFETKAVPEQYANAGSEEPTLILVKVGEDNGIIHGMVYDRRANRLMSESIYHLKDVEVGQIVNTPVGPALFVGESKNAASADQKQGEPALGSTLRKSIIKGLKLHLYGGVERADNDPASVKLTFNHFMVQDNLALLGIAKVDSKAPMKHGLEGTWILMSKSQSTWVVVEAFPTKAALLSSEIIRSNRIPSNITP